MLNLILFYPYIESRQLNTDRSNSNDRFSWNMEFEGSA